jgi:SAM-dependent methyltransferase
MTWLSDLLERYVAEMEPFERSTLRAARQNLIADLTGRILEIGCGLGQSFPCYAPGTQVIAIEPFEPFRARVSEVAAQSPAHIEVVGGDAHATGFDSGSFDAYVTSLVLCSVDNPARALSEMRRILKPGGQFRLLEHVRAGGKIQAALQHVMNPAWKFFDGAGCNLNRDTLSTIRSAGFIIDRVDSVKIPGSIAVPFPGLAIYART